MDDAAKSIQKLTDSIDTNLKATVDEFAKASSKIQAALAKSVPTQMNIGDILGEPPKSGLKTRFKFEKLKQNILSNITKNLPTTFSFDKAVTIPDILGEPPEASLWTRLKFQRLKRTLLDHISKNLPKRFSFDRSVTIQSILGETPNSSLIYKFKFEKLKQNLLDHISKNLPKRFSFDRSVTVEGLLGETPNSSLIYKFKFERIKRTILDLLSKNLPKKFSFDKLISIDGLLGESPKTSFLYRRRFAKIKNTLLNDIQKGVPRTFDFDKTISIESLLGESPIATKEFTRKFSELKMRILDDLSNIDFKEAILSLDQPSSTVDIQPAELNQEITNISNTDFDTDEINNNLNSLLLSFNNFFEWMKGNDLSQEENRRENNDLMESIADSIREDKKLGSVDSKENSLIGGLLSKLKIGGAAAGGLGTGIGMSIAGLGKGLGEGIGSLVKGIGKGLGSALKSLSNPKYFIGVGVLSALASAIWLGSKAFESFGDDINWKNVGIGVGILSAMAAGLTLLGTSSTQILMGAAALAAVGAAIIPAAFAFKSFGDDINWKNVGIGVGILSAMAAGLTLLGNVAPQILMGAAALAAVGAAIIPAAFAFKSFGDDINWKNVGIGLGVLGGLAVVSGILSFAAPVIIAGSAAIAVLGASLIPAAAAFMIFGKAAEFFSGAMGEIADGAKIIMGAIVNGITTVLDSLTGSIIKLSEISGEGLFSVAGGITALGVALIGFSASNMVAGIGNLIGNFLGGDPVKRFERFASIGDKLTIAAKSIGYLGESIKIIDPDKLKSAANGFKTFTNTLSDGILKKDPMKPMRELIDILSTATPYIKTFDVIASSMGSFAVFAKQLDQGLDTDNLSHFLDVLFDPAQGKNSDILNVFSAGTDFLNSLENADIAKFEALRNISKIPNETGETIYGISAANEEAANNNIILAVNNSIKEGGKSITSNSSSVVVNKSDAIDSTRASMLFRNTF